MKIKKLAIMVLMTTFFIILATKVYATNGTINAETVKLRKGPDSKTVLDLLDEGDEVEILEQEEGWYKVKAITELGKVTGYVSEEEVDVGENKKTDKPVKNPEVAETTSPDVNVPTPEPVISSNIEENNQYTLQQEISVKALPLINSIEKAKISGNVTIIEIINDWARVESETESGWVRKNTLKQSIAQIENTPQEPEEQPVENVPVETPNEESQEQENEKTEITKINKTGYVSAEGLRVRKEPSTDSEEIDSLSKNDKVEIIGQTGNWYKIDIDGREGYVSAKYISDTKVPETTSRSGSTLKNETASTTEEAPKVEETPKTEQTTATETSGTTGAAIVEYAKQYLGYKYVSGGASPQTGFDCSGFTTYVYKHFGISLNRASTAQINNGVAVEKSDLQLGDLVIFNNEANTKIGHVGIYIGDGNFIHASNPKDGVKITTLLTGYYKQRYVGARRVI